MSEDFKIATWDNEPVIDYIPAKDELEDDLSKIMIRAANNGLEWALQDSFPLFDIKDGKLNVGIWNNVGKPIFRADLGSEFDLCSISDNCDYKNYPLMADIFESYAKGLRDWFEEITEEQKRFEALEDG